MCKRDIINPNPPENHYKFWATVTMRLLGKKYEDCTYEQLAKIFGRTKGAMRTRACILRIAIRLAPYTDDILPVMKYKYSEGQKKRMTTEEGRKSNKRALELALEKAHTPKANAKRSKAMMGKKSALGCTHSQKSRENMSVIMKNVWAKKKAEKGQ